MTGQTLSRVRNPYPEAAPLERRPLRRVRVVIAWAWRCYLRHIDRHLDGLSRWCGAVALACLFLDLLAAYARTLAP